MNCWDAHRRCKTIVIQFFVWSMSHTLQKRRNECKFKMESVKPMLRLFLTSTDHSVFPVWPSKIFFNKSPHLLLLISDIEVDNNVNYVRIIYLSESIETTLISNAIPVWAKKQGSKEPAIYWRLIHDNGIFLIVSRVTGNSNNSILHQKANERKMSMCWAITI